MESFQGTRREEVLDREEIDTLKEAKSRIEIGLRNIKQKDLIHNYGNPERERKLKNEFGSLWHSG